MDGWRVAGWELARGLGSRGTVAGRVVVGCTASGPCQRHRGCPVRLGGTQAGRCSIAAKSRKELCLVAPWSTMWIGWCQWMLRRRPKRSRAVIIKTAIIEEHLLNAPDDGHIALPLLEAAALRDCIVVQQAKPSSLGGHYNGGGDRKNASYPPPHRYSTAPMGVRGRCCMVEATVRRCSTVHPLGARLGWHALPACGFCCVFSLWKRSLLVLSFLSTGDHPGGAHRSGSPSGCCPAWRAAQKKTCCPPCGRPAPRALACRSSPPPGTLGQV